jgi:hypothetical protein
MSRICTRIRSAPLLVIILFGLAFIGSCAGDAPLPETNPGSSIPTPTPAGLPVLGPPLTLLRSASAAIDGPVADGREFDAALPSRYVAASRHSLVLEFPTADEESTRFSTAYALYRFHLSSSDLAPRISFGGGAAVGYEHDLGTDEWTEVSYSFVGLANWQTGRWTFLPIPATGVVELGGLAPYIDGAGNLLLTFMLQNPDAFYFGMAVDWIRIGDTPWLVEDFPTSFSQGPAIAFKKDGTPVVAVNADGGVQLYERGSAGWTGRTLANGGDYGVGPMVLDNQDEPNILGSLGYRDWNPGQFTTFSEYAIVTESSAPTVLFTNTVVDPALGGPPGPGGMRPPYLGSGTLRIDPATGRLAAYYSISHGYALAEFSAGAGWHPLKAPAAYLHDVSYAPGGALRAVTLTGTEDEVKTLWHYVKAAGKGWDSEAIELPVTSKRYYGSPLLVGQDQVLVTVNSTDAPGPSLLTRESGGWETEPLSEPGVPGPHRELRAITDAGGTLRFYDRERVYTRTGWGTLQSRPVEVPQFGPFEAAFDSAGKLHAIGYLDDGSGGYFSHVVYVREP